MYYIPHHYVTKNPRVVFDASARTYRGLSFNQIQLNRPKLQKDLPEVVMRMRRHKIAICADVKKMFNQVQINTDQWNLLRIVWRETPNEPLREYYLTVVPFGLKAFGFLAIGSMIQSARDAKMKSLMAAKTIEDDFYVDDCATGANTIGDAFKLASDMSSILKGAGSELCKWTLDSPDLIKLIGSEMKNTEIAFSEEEGTAILCLKWLNVEG